MNSVRMAVMQMSDEQIMQVIDGYALLEADEVPAGIHPVYPMIAQWLRNERIPESAGSYTRWIDRFALEAYRMAWMRGIVRTTEMRF